jgi:hypothetical protein
VFGKQQIRRPVRRHDQHLQLVELASQEADQINRRDIRPMQIIKENDEWLDVRDGAQKGCQLPFHPFLRGGLDVGQQARRLFAVA